MIMNYRLTFSYDNKEKTTITSNLTKDDIETITKAIVESGDSGFVQIAIPSKKEDVLLLNKKNLVSLFASIVEEKE